MGQVFMHCNPIHHKQPQIFQSKGKEHTLYVNAALRPLASLKQNPVSQPTYYIRILVVY